jgi:MerR family copper efflux transcriptional regulator
VRNLQDYLTIREAANLVGVSPSTLRAWDRAGKLKAARNPMNHYRLYRREDVEALLARIERTASAKTRPERGRRKGSPAEASSKEGR